MYQVRRVGWGAFSLTNATGGIPKELCMRIAQVSGVAHATILSSNPRIVVIELVGRCRNRRAAIPIIDVVLAMLPPGIIIEYILTRKDDWFRGE